MFYFGLGPYKNIHTTFRGELKLVSFSFVVNYNLDFFASKKKLLKKENGIISFVYWLPSHF